MSTIATKRGDGGNTFLLSGQCVSKADLRLRAYGTVDELSATLGLCRVHAYKDKVQVLLHTIQAELVQLMGELATEDAHVEKYLANATEPISEEHVAAFDREIQKIESRSGGFNGWQYSGETVAQSFFELARTTCRRAEREIVCLRESNVQVRPVILSYMNRLSDLLWLLGR
ncbi:MAG: cob(I)yrinic acid a,c-diamide adenosyltransferase, partial [Verrucomicrobiota bacterium]